MVVYVVQLLLSLSRAPRVLLIERAGWLIAAGLLAGMGATWWAPGYVLAGTLYWLALLGLWSRLSVRTRRQALVMIAVGVGGLLGAAARGPVPAVEQLLTSNAPLLTMLVAVSFLSLVARPVDEGSLPRGRRGLLSTLLGVHLFGAVINLSALFIFGDRMAREGQLERRQVLSLERAFSACAFWSPFFAAMAVALSVAPAAELTTLWLLGLPLAALSLGLTYREMTRLGVGQAAFVGYPLNYRSLVMPLLLAAGVLLCRYLSPGWSILAIISLLAPLLTAVLLLPRRGEGGRRLAQHIDQRLPNMANELGLFLAAGMLSLGLGALLTGLDSGGVFSQFGPAQASATLLVMLLLAFLGIHPLISISLLGPLVAPLDPDPDLLALVCLSAWAMGVTLGPLSGVHLSLQGRYGADARQLVRWNLGYGAWMVLAIVGMLHLYGYLAGL